MSAIPSAIARLARPFLRACEQRPTAALPGTPEKIAVLKQRAARREPLFHPGDAQAAQLGERLAVVGRRLTLFTGAETSCGTSH